MALNNKIMNDLILTLILPLARYSSPGEALLFLVLLTLSKITRIETTNKVRHSYEKVYYYFYICYVLLRYSMWANGFCFEGLEDIFTQ